MTVNFLSKGFELNSWEDISPWFEEMLNRDISSYELQLKWIRQRSEFDAFISEELAWRYINFTRFTNNSTYKSRYENFINDIQPNLAKYDNILNKKLLSVVNAGSFTQPAYSIYFRTIEQEIKLFREENVPLFTKIDLKSNEFSELVAGLSINYKGKNITLQQASAYYESVSRITRKTVFEKVRDARMAVQASADDIYSQLVKLRHQVALNAGHLNYRDYSFEAMCRFDYTLEQNLDLLDSIRDQILPVVTVLENYRKKKLNINKLKPYDLSVDTESRKQLRPFKSNNELISKSISCFNKVGAQLGHYLERMNEMKLFDLDSRQGKAPGGYNYPLDKTGAPFIFMNSALRHGDMVTFMHEGGHAVHSFLSNKLDLVYFRHPPSEVAELASMSMELMSMEHWDEFFKSKDDLRRAKLKQLGDILGILPWIAIIDKFQHWVYTNPGHSVTERTEKWNNIYSEYSTGIVRWEGYENYRDIMWQKQGHLFDVPFYYIEYAIAQLGAIAIWMNYKKNPEKTLKQYCDALTLGYTKPVPEIYATAGIEFDFSSAYISKLASFIMDEIEKLTE